MAMSDHPSNTAVTDRFEFNVNVRFDVLRLSSASYPVLAFSLLVLHAKVTSSGPRDVVEEDRLQ